MREGWSPRPGSTAVTATSGSLAASAGVEVVEISSDRDVPRLLYRTVGGDGWQDNTNWLTGAPLSDWAGVTTYENGRVRCLEPRDNGLDGPIPRSLGRLDQLFILTLAGNSPSRRIPAEIGQLRRLRDRYLDDNELSGPLPAAMGGMAGLRSLGVSGNDLSGPVPKTFARITLDRFYFTRTHVCIPRGLRAWHGSIEETEDDPLRCIPLTADQEALAALYRATGGPAWDESENWLSDLPINTWSGVTTDEDGHVTELILSDNNLRGPLPREIGDLPHLELLWLHRNALSGTIPPESSLSFHCREDSARSRSPRSQSSHRTRIRAVGPSAGCRSCPSWTHPIHRREGSMPRAKATRRAVALPALRRTRSPPPRP